MRCIQLFFDGACEPVNPGGIGAYGFAAFDEGREAYGEGGVVCFGERWCTNNYAEYAGLVKALEWALAGGFDCVSAFGDSQLVVRQMLGLYAVRAPNLKPLHERALELSRGFKRFSISWVPREESSRADYYSKRAYCDFLKSRPDLRERYARWLATERQLELLRRLGVEVECLTKAEASRLIKKALANRGET
ncbi:ribonuclease HI [Pyrobaculum aerophilum]|uniref:Ribonuclease H n=1 Tax=Pyrobaculum aerophilum TaxID=13773 RepID=A0A371R359_9CREN|nr:ribonuclease HI [Pyrobaculum aerophilum]RFA95127.1 ribonuclease H [Pyrobaculum aerophilum]RFA98242.1 ribonuclease H [Pyrobaculum aerophilum]